MSDQELGKKMVEEEELLYFLEAYKEAVEEYLSHCSSHERPDFICYRPDGTPVGIELVKIMRDPRDAQADRILDKVEFMDGEEAMEFLYHMKRISNPMVLTKSGSPTTRDWRPMATLSCSACTPQNGGDSMKGQILMQNRMDKPRTTNNKKARTKKT